MRSTDGRTERGAHCAMGTSFFRTKSELWIDWKMKVKFTKNVLSCLVASCCARSKFIWRFFFILSLGALIPFYIYWFSVLVAYYYFYSLACVFRVFRGVVVFLFLLRTKFLVGNRSKSNNKMRAYMRQRQQTEIYMQIFSFSLHTLWNNFVFCMAATIHTVSISSRSHFICSVSKNKSNQKVNGSERFSAE